MSKSKAMMHHDPSDYLSYMQKALSLARQAGEAQEVPVGAVIVGSEGIIGRGFNQPISACDPSAHAEVMALRDAGQHQSNYRVPGSTLYVTIEPCTMCFGAIVHARVGCLVYGAAEPKSGMFSNNAGILRSTDDPRVKFLPSGTYFNHSMTIVSGVCESESRELIQAFFKCRRHTKKQLQSNRIQPLIDDNMRQDE